MHTSGQSRVADEDTLDLEYEGVSTCHLWDVAIDPLLGRLHFVPHDKTSTHRLCVQSG